MAISARNAMSAEVQRNLLSIFKRCVQCPDATPSCPDCPNGQICSLVPASCDACQYMTCIANPTPSQSSSSTNVGAVAGGVIAGLVVFGIALYFVWRRWDRKRKRELDLEEWEEEIARRKFGANGRSDAASTRTRASLATSILSRASNIIQIAYIPGVTNRNGSSHNSLAPVPPIPAMYANSAPKSPLANDGDMLFFRPGSTYSATSSRSGNNRDTQYTSFSRQSISPSLARMSVASDVYRDDASVEPMPATQVVRLAPRMVSVKSSPLAGPSESVNGITTPGKVVKVMVPGQTSAAAAGGVAMKPTQVNVARPNSRGKGRFPVRSPSTDLSNKAGHRTSLLSSPLIEASTESEDDDQDEHARARQSLIKTSSSRDSGSTVSSPLATAQPLQSPFFDASELQQESSVPSSTPSPAPTTSSTTSSSTTPRPNPYAAMSSTVKATSPTSSSPPRRAGNRTTFGGLGAVIEEATKLASSTENSTRGDHSPFSDEHAAD